MSALQIVTLLGSLASSVAAHGYVSNIVVGGKSYQGYNPAFQYQNPPPIVAGWSDPLDLDNGFVPPQNYTSPDIICHKGATPGQTSIPVAAGSKVEFEWTPWPDSHHGPVITYLANCNGDCSKVDKTTLQFFKVDAEGLETPGSPGTWATDKLIAANNSWTFTVPSSIAAGNYVARHEIIALHSAGSQNGAQNYPQCINFQVTGGGSDKPTGTLGEKLYTPTDPGILINIYQSNTAYPIPGPPLYSGAASSGSNSPASPAPSASMALSASAVSSAVAQSSAPAQAAPPVPSASKKACKKKRTSFKA